MWAPDFWESYHPLTFEIFTAYVNFDVRSNGFKPEKEQFLKNLQVNFLKIAFFLAWTHHLQHQINYDKPFLQRIYNTKYVNFIGIDDF